MSSLIQTKNLTKYYGKTLGVKNLNLQVKKGEIFGFLGPNGAGKSTTIRLLLNIINPTKGQVMIFGKDMAKNYPEIQESIGYLPGEVNLYPKRTGKQLLKFASQVYKIKSLKFAHEVAKKLDCDMKKPFSRLSSGNKQKIGILLSLFHQPQLLILDEPTTGLDPLIQNELYKLLLKLNQQGTTIFFSSHNLPEVEKVCHRIGIIRKGHLVDIAPLEELRRKRRKRVEIEFDGKYNKKDFTQNLNLKMPKETDHSFSFYLKNQEVNKFIKILSKYPVKNLNFEDPELEEVFIKYYEHK